MKIEDDIDDELDMDEAGIRADVLRRARSEGARAAYLSALEICQDKNAPAVARASSQRTLLALAGLMDKAERQTAVDKPPSEMTPDELQAAVAGLLREREQAAGQSRSTKARGTAKEKVGVFG